MARCASEDLNDILSETSSETSRKTSSETSSETSSAALMRKAGVLLSRIQFVEECVQATSKYFAEFQQMESDLIQLKMRSSVVPEGLKKRIQELLDAKIKRPQEYKEDDIVSVYAKAILKLTHVQKQIYSLGNDLQRTLNMALSDRNNSRGNPTWIIQTRINQLEELLYLVRPLEATEEPLIVTHYVENSLWTRDFTLGMRL